MLSDKLIKTVLSLANSQFGLLTPNEQNLANDQLKLWKNSRNKQFMDSDSDPNFGLCYVKSLYKTRVDCFYDLLRHIADNDEVRERLKQSTEILSLCCGSGPEITAYVSFVRSFLQIPYGQLNITGYDKYDHWRQFIEVIAPVDPAVLIKFKPSNITTQFVRNLQNNKYHVCIMSYPQAVDFDRNIWYWLKRKFRLIIVLDQINYELHVTVKKHGFQIDSFEWLGTKKYFYWNDECQQVSTPKIVEVKEPIQHCGVFHENKGMKCFNKIQHEFECGHSTKFDCHSYDDEIKTKRCEKMVTITRICGHEIDIKCAMRHSTLKDCEEIVTMKHEYCDHSIDVKCAENLQKRICNADIRYKFECGHTAIFKCHSYHEHIKSKKCEKMITITKDCGHIEKIKCRFKEQELNKKCEQLVQLWCKNVHHTVEVKCCDKKAVRDCDKFISHTFECGHTKKLRCQSYNEDIKSMKCEEIITITKYCGHQFDVKCGLKNQAMNSNCEKLLKFRFQNCNHELKIKCFDKKTVRYCDKFISHTFECGHTKKLKCHSYNEDIKSMKCEEIVTITKDCGHTSKINCNLRSTESYEKCEKLIIVNCDKCGDRFYCKCCDKNNKPPCMNDRQHKFQCGHTSTFKCHSYDEDIKSKKCEEMIESNYDKCDHSFSTKCCNRINKPLCNADIQHKFQCGHAIIIKCHFYKVGKNIYCENCNLRKQDSNYRSVPQINEGNTRVTSDVNSSKICGLLRICGHNCLQKSAHCYGEIHQKCLEQCYKKLECGHLCILNCHLELFAWHKCHTNCLSFKLNQFFIHSPKSMDFSSKEKWSNLSDRFQTQDVTLTSHIKILVDYMIKIQKYSVIVMIKDEIYDLLVALLNLYTSANSIADNTDLKDRCRRLIILINVNEPYLLRSNITNLSKEMIKLQKTVKLGESQ